jgi:tetratricopeptide (TPR) repeat protein
MTAGSPFITQLRSSWATKFASGLPFVFRAVAGVKDEFVPIESSVKPFPGYEAYVNGNHLEIVNPELPSSDTTVLLKLFLAQTARGPEQPTRTPGETDAAQNIEQLWPQKADLFDKGLVKLALSLELVGKQEESIALLREFASRSTELTSVLAGRLKRRWLADPSSHSADGSDAWSLYRQSFVRAAQVADHAQAFYAGINVAFLELAMGERVDEIRIIAIRVPDHCRASKTDKWQLATMGEAYLYLADIQAALAYYEAALESQPDMREIDSMQRQAIWVARLLKFLEAESRLQKLFESGPK